MITIINSKEVAAEFYLDLMRQGKEERTARQYQTIVLKYLNETDVKIHDVKLVKKSLLSYMDKLRSGQYREKTIQFHITALNLFYDFMEDDDWIDRNPVPLVRKRYLNRYKPEEPPKYQNWNPEQVNLMIETAGKMKNKVLWQAVIASYASSGIRRGELPPLNIGDVNYEERIFHLHNHKKRSNRDICFSDWALDYILDWLELRMD